MDSFELNKIFCAILATVFVTMSLSLASGALFYSEAPEVPGFEIATLEPVESEEEDAGPLFEPITPILASADIAAGEAEFKKCSSCHNVEPGGANGVGPALHGVMGRDIASVDGYGYSQALLAYGEGKQWTWEEMNGFLWKPKTYVKGTAMGFAGIRGVEDRANIVAYLNAQSDSPLDLPDPAAMEVMAEGDEAEGTVAASAVAPETEAAAENLVEGAVEGTDAAANTDAADNPAVTGMGGEEPETPATE